MHRRLGLVAFAAVFLIGACGGKPFPTASVRAPVPADPSGAIPVVPAGPTDPPITPAPKPTPTEQGTPAEKGTATGQVFGAPAAPGATLDVAEANHVAKQLWNRVITARRDGDLATLTRIETGPALEADLGERCGCATPGALQRLAVNVPRQQSWPLSIFASAIYTDGCDAAPCDDSFVAVQQKQGAPWKIASFVSDAGPVDVSLPEALSDGWAVAPTASALLADAPTAYAAYLETLNRTGQVETGSDFETGPFTSGFATQFANFRDMLTSGGFNRAIRYFADPRDPVWRFVGSPGAQIACGTVRYTDTITSAADDGVPPDFSVVDSGVPAGAFSSVTIHGLHMQCFVQVPGEQRLAVFGTWGETTRITTTPYVSTTTPPTGPTGVVNG